MESFCCRLSPASWTILTSRSVPLDDSTPARSDTRYGYGWFVRGTGNAQILSAKGDHPGFTAQLRHRAADDVAVAVLSVGASDLDAPVELILDGLGRD